jgi:hypothetical protein
MGDLEAIADRSGEGGERAAARGRKDGEHVYLVVVAARGGSERALDGSAGGGGCCASSAAPSGARGQNRTAEGRDYFLEK